VCPPIISMPLDTGSVTCFGKCMGARSQTRYDSFLCHVVVFSHTLSLIGCHCPGRFFTSEKLTYHGDVHPRILSRHLCAADEHEGMMHGAILPFNTVQRAVTATPHPAGDSMLSTRLAPRRNDPAYVKIRDFAYPADGERDVGLRPDVPRANTSCTTESSSTWKDSGGSWESVSDDR
jgi:hypothetical protein